MRTNTFTSVIRMPSRYSDMSLSDMEYDGSGERKIGYGIIDSIVTIAFVGVTIYFGGKTAYYWSRSVGNSILTRMKVCAPFVVGTAVGLAFAAVEGNRAYCDFTGETNSVNDFLGG